MVDSPAELADRDVVFTMVAGPDDFKEVVLGPAGVLSGNGAAPARDRRHDHRLAGGVAGGPRRGGASAASALLAAPVSGNPKVVAAGLLTIVVSGPREAFDAGRARCSTCSARA